MKRLSSQSIINNKRTLKSTSNKDNNPIKPTSNKDNNPIKINSNNLIKPTSTYSDLETYIPNDWMISLNQEINLPYFQTIKNKLDQDIQSNKIIYPPKHQIFSFMSCPLDKVKVVILGQDPYHGPNQANGLSFSVPNGVKFPPSLKNIFKELLNDDSIHPFSIPNHGDLSCWSIQGVLLLNACLTVEKQKPNSHNNYGWNTFTQKIIEIIHHQSKHVVFMLWGSFAQKLKHSINKDCHLVLESPHPSPLSAYRGFLGNKHFSKANLYLIEKGKSPINWNLFIESKDNDKL